MLGPIDDTLEGKPLESLFSPRATDGVNHDGRFGHRESAKHGDPTLVGDRPRELRAATQTVTSLRAHERTDEQGQVLAEILTEAGLKLLRGSISDRVVDSELSSVMKNL